MNNELYPSLYNEANSASLSGQRFFTNQVRLEYLLLLIASLLTLPFSNNRVYMAAVALTFCVLIGVTLWRALSGPDKDWYNGRAVAESVKTLTWRYAMKAAPFGNEPLEPNVTQRFGNELAELLKSNKGLGKGLAAHTDTGEQITNKMNILRNLPFRKRLTFYLSDRVDEQREWYSRKAKFNNSSFNFWIFVTIFLYIIGISLALCRIIWTDFDFFPIDSVVVLAGCSLGWLQIKKFSELSAAYSLTANEIGLIKARASAVKTESEFFEFVKDAEFAFSREHTQWIVRQSS